MTTNTVVTNNTSRYSAADVDNVYDLALLISPLIKTTEDRLVSYVDNRTDPVLLEFLQHLIRDHPIFKAEFTAFMARKKMGIE
jgi:hypothetical protein